MQAGVTIAIDQLRRARLKCDPTHTFAKKADDFEPTEEHCEFLRVNRVMGPKKLHAAFNAKFGPVRATADGRGRRRSGGRSGRRVGGLTRGRTGCADAGGSHYHHWPATTRAPEV